MRLPRLFHLFHLFLCVVCLLPWRASGADAYHAHYRYLPPAQGVDIGAQPLAFPVAMFSTLMGRDAILARQLEARRLTLKIHPYHKGEEMVALLEGDRLDVAFLGDMPTIVAAATQDVAVVGLVKQTFSSVIGKNYMPLNQLKGRRVGYAHGSTAHYALLQGLASVGLSDTDVTLVPLEINEMPEALAGGRIDAFSAWEPAPTVALNMGKEFAVIYRGVSTSYMSFGHTLVTVQPDAAREIGAAFVRALRWMKKSEHNLLQTAAWALADGERFSGKPSRLTAKDAAGITRREILDVVSGPVIPPNLIADNELINREFSFLEMLGKLPPQAVWSKVKNSFVPGYLQEVVAAPAKYRLNEFDYVAP